MDKYLLTQVTPSLKDEYTRFVSSHSFSMMYHTWEYKDFIKKLLRADENYLAAIDSQGKIKGIIPLLFKDGPFGKVFNSLPFYGSNGGILASSKECFDFLVNEYNSFLLNQDLAACTLITNPLIVDDDYSNLLTTNLEHRIGQFTTFYKEGMNDEELMKTFHFKTRNMIRKAIKEGIKVSVENNMIEFLYQTHTSNMHGIGGKPKPMEYYQNLFAYYVPNKDFKIYVARLNNEPVAAMLLYYYNKTVEYYTPVIVESFREKQPLSLLIYSAMQEACRTGFNSWNWGGTWASQNGVYTFKKRWGTHDIEYYYHTYVKNHNIYNATKEELLTHYDNFFVVSFSLLKNQK